jgi:hypothetical protein
LYSVSSKGLEEGQLNQEYFSWKGTDVQKELEPVNRGLVIIRNRYQATTSEDTEGWKGLGVILYMWK